MGLQLVGLQVMIGALGVSGEGLMATLPLIISFAILAAFDYSSGLRAPAAIAIVKDVVIYLTAFTADPRVALPVGGVREPLATADPASARLSAERAGPLAAHRAAAPRPRA